MFICAKRSQNIPGKDLTVVTWTGRPEIQLTAKDIFKDKVFGLSERYYYNNRIGKKDFLTLVNSLVKEFKGTA